MNNGQWAKGKGQRAKKDERGQMKDGRWKTDINAERKAK
jgi:hypothetical protein